MMSMDMMSTAMMSMDMMSMDKMSMDKGTSVTNLTSYVYDVSAGKQMLNCQNEGGICCTCVS